MASGREGKAEQRLCWPHSHLGPQSYLASRQVVAGRTPSTLSWQQDFPRPHLPRTSEPQVCTAAQHAL